MRLSSPHSLFYWHEVGMLLLSLIPREIAKMLSVVKYNPNVYPFIILKRISPWVDKACAVPRMAESKTSLSNVAAALSFFPTHRSIVELNPFSAFTWTFLLYLISSLLLVVSAYCQKNNCCAQL